jgi:predicted TIM-barrel fold metal-dependent hydrolase
MNALVARQSPWGPLVIADAHVHFFSHKFFELLAAQGSGLTLEAMQQKLGWDFPPADPKTFGDEWARELDRHGVDRAALIASLPGDQGSVLAAAHGHPDRFFPYAMVNPRAWQPEAMAGIQVACLFPAMHRYSMHDEIVNPVFDWAQQANAGKRAVFVHCGVLSVGVRKKLGLASPFDMRFSNPIDLHAAALANPTVPIIIPHFGGGYFREALMVADLCPNIYLETSSSNSWIHYQEGALTLRDVFRKALDVVGPQRLLFGTDSSFFPRGWHFQIFEEQAKALYELGVRAPEAHAIFRDNLLRLLLA